MSRVTIGRIVEEKDGEGDLRSAIGTSRRLLDPGGAVMRCPVCQGSGLSGATAFVDRVVECGGCKGAGWLLDEPELPARSGLGDDREPRSRDRSTDDPDGSDVRRAAAAFDRFAMGLSSATYRRLANEGVGRDEWATLTPLQRWLRRFDLDQRYRELIPDTLPGRADRSVEERLQRLVDDHRQLAAIAEPGGRGSERGHVERGLANALRSLGQARESLHDEDGAEAAYEEARACYGRLGMDAESASVVTALRRLRLRRDQDLDHGLAELHDQLEVAPPGADRAQLLIELGELHAARHDDAKAREFFLEAEQELEPYRAQATGTGIAGALIASLSELERGEVPSLLGRYETITRITTLLQRAYAGSAQTLAATDPVAAQRYLDRQARLQGSSGAGDRDNLDFSARVLGELQRRYGLTNPEQGPDA